jgi:sulfite reductase alpha subunit-like flavoprotein
VQDLLKSKSADVYRKLVKSRGHLYVCGDVTMAADVIETVTKIFEDEGGMSQAEAKNNIIKMKVNVFFSKKLIKYLL